MSRLIVNKKIINGIVIVLFAFIIDISLVMSEANLLKSEEKKLISLKILSISHSKIKDKDSLKILIDSNLPKGTILKIQLISNLISAEARKIVEKEIFSCLFEIQPNGKYQGTISDFPWEFPPAVYTIKVILSEKQKKNILPNLPTGLIGKNILQSTVVIGGGLKEVIDFNRRQFSDLQEIWSFYETATKSLNRFIELYNNQKLKENEKSLQEWHNKTIPEINKISDKASFLSYDNYPGWYRLSFDLVNMVGSNIHRQENVLLSTFVNVPSKYSEPAPKSIKPISEEKANIEKAKDFLIKESILEMVRILQYYTETVNITFLEIKDKAERKNLWKQAEVNYQAELGRFDEYFVGFQKDYNSDNLKPLYKIVSEYHELAEKLTKTCTAIVNEGETEKSIKTIKDITNKMNILFTKLLEILK